MLRCRRGSENLPRACRRGDAPPARAERLVDQEVGRSYPPRRFPAPWLSPRSGARGCRARGTRSRDGSSRSAVPTCRKTCSRLDGLLSDLLGVVDVREHRDGALDGEETEAVVADVVRDAHAVAGLILLDHLETTHGDGGVLGAKGMVKVAMEANLEPDPERVSHEILQNEKDGSPY